MHDPDLSSAIVGTSFSGWCPSFIAEFNGAARNGQVGTRLLSDCGIVRIWEVRLAPRERLGFHHHVLDYFWTVLTSGRARSRTSDGSTHEIVYRRGDTKEMRYRNGEGMIHDLENIGSTLLLFVTVEFLDSASAPLKISTPHSLS